MKLSTQIKSKVKPSTSSNSTKKPKYHRTEEFELNDGDILVYRDTRSGQFWRMRVWISDEKRYDDKSLKTKDKENAIVIAKERYLDIQWKIKNGQPIFDKSVGELIQMYLDDQKERIHYGRVGKGGDGTITEGRWGTKKTQLNRHLIGFMTDVAQGANTKLSTIYKDMFKIKYTKYRRKKNPDVQNVSIINERAEIGAVFRFGCDKGMLQHHQLPKFEKMEKSGNTRPSFTRGQWKEIYTYLRSWNKNLGDRVKPTGGYSELDELDKRQFVRYFILILCNTGIRIGECRELKWKDISLEQEEDGSLSSIINIRIGKTGPRKGVVGRKGEYFRKIKEFSNYRSGEDYVFVENTTGEKIGDKTIYRLWDEMIDNTSLKDTSEEYTYYCLRHTYATFRIRSGTSPYRLAKNMGTSLKELERTYDHSYNQDARKELTSGKMTESDRVLMEV